MTQTQSAELARLREEYQHRRAVEDTAWKNYQITRMKCDPAYDAWSAAQDAARAAHKRYLTALNEAMPLSA